MENKTYHTVGTASKSNIKIVERGNIDSANTQIQDRALSWLGIGHSIKMAGFSSFYFTNDFVYNFDAMLSCCECTKLKEYI